MMTFFIGPNGSDVCQSYNFQKTFQNLLVILNYNYLNF